MKKIRFTLLLFLFRLDTLNLQKVLQDLSEVELKVVEGHVT